MTRETDKSAEALWNEADSLFDNESPVPGNTNAATKVGADNQQGSKDAHTETAPSVVDDIAVPSEVWDTDTTEMAPKVTPNTNKGQISASQAEATDMGSSKPTGRAVEDPKGVDNAQPLKTDSYTKAKKYRSSLKAFYPHLGIAAVSLCFVMFPGLGEMIFSAEDLEKMPDWLVDNFSLFVRAISGFITAFLILVILKQQSSGVIKVFGDYLQYKKGLMDSTTIHYSDIRTIDVQRCLASMYAPIGDLHIITSREHIVMPNLYEPFRLKEAIEMRRSELRL
tara:strand:- start:11152 stop:11994 length:843 start_codon:yes stop_codon:yes gene_type:complete